ncbi:MAG: hypothetical protein IKY44_06265 [Clostridia bacterium]|nr:hypothetical protein [Clostridia bacterium]
MKKVRKEIADTYKKLNPISKFSIKYGILLSYAIMVAAIYLYILFYGDVSNWVMIRTANELIECSLGCILSTLISAFIAELVYQKYSS